MYIVIYLYEDFTNTSTYLHLNNITNSKDNKRYNGLYTPHRSLDTMQCLLKTLKFNLFSKCNIYWNRKGVS